MIINTIGGGGGTSLNFTVVGGTTQPGSPEKNTIWVNTSTGITGWIFSAEQPSNPTSGLVWFIVGTSSATEFNALKKNGIQVYPLYAKQFVDGAWLSVTTKIYQAGEWSLMFNGELYKAGNEYELITGGWSAKGWKYNESYTEVTPTLTKSATKMTAVLTRNGTNACSGVIHTGNDIDLTPFNKLTVVLPLVKATGTLSAASHAWIYGVVVVSRNAQYYYTDCVASNRVLVDDVATYTNVTLDVDISGIPAGAYDIALTISGYGTSYTITMEVESVILS